MSTSTNTAEFGRLAVSACELGESLGINERHVWAMHSKELLGPELLALGGARRWGVEEVTQWVAAGAPPRVEWRKLWQPKTKNDLPLQPNNEE